MSVLHAPLLALAILSVSSAVSAADLSGPGGIQPDDAGAARAALLDSAKLVDSELGSLSGGQEAAALTNQTLTAVSSGNTINATSVTNGPVSLSANAFSGFAGIGNFVINTGNNNNLQGSLSVNIVVAPGS